MEIVLVVAVLVVAVAVLYVAVTLGPRTRQSTAPMIDEAAKDISGRIEDLKGQLTAIAGELEQDRDHTRVEGRKIQGRLDHADSRTGSIANRLLAEMDTIRRLGEQVSARQDQLSDDLRQLDQQVARLQAGQEAPDGVTAGSSPTLPGQLYVERLRFSIVRIQPESFSRSERRYRIQVERDVGELPASRLGDALAITERAKDDEGFRERLSKAAADYLATKWGDPAFAVVTERWVTQDTFPETAAAETCNRIANGLDAIVAKPLEQAGSEIRLPGPEAAAAADLGSALVLQPVADAVGQVTRFLEVTGVVVGTATGLQPLALAATKMLAHDQFHDWVARGLREAARTVFGGPEGPAEGHEPAAPATAPQPARPAGGPAEADAAAAPQPARPAGGRAEADAAAAPQPARPADGSAEADTASAPQPARPAGGPAEAAPPPGAAPASRPPASSPPGSPSSSTDTWWAFPSMPSRPRGPDGPATGGPGPG